DSIWSGLMAGLTWLGFLAFLACRPDALLPWSLAYPADLPMVEVMRLQEAAGALNVEAWIRESLVAVLVGIMLGAAVSRSRILLTRAMVAERARANLARYFSPAIVDHLEFRDDPLGTPRTGNVGVLFVDIVGFTRLVEQVTPAEVIELLRHFHALVASIVFLHNGTLDKYIGDAAMATFGTPSPMPDDAGRTLACAKALALAIDDWNGRRRAHGYPEVRIGIGAHYGVVVMGDIGDERRLEFAVLGDTVNVAARLEHLTRSIDARIVVSEALVEAAAREGGDLDALLAGFAPLDSQHLEGRDLPVAVRVSR
ncbi:MAG: adenylate/guanylate cyclase domain-containing protein, partial [Azospirillaceae bacterium]